MLVFDHFPYEEFKEVKPEFSTVKLMLLPHIFSQCIPEKDLLCVPMKWLQTGNSPTPLLQPEQARFPQPSPYTDIAL